MSDPLSTAASVAGLVSLGLQVYSGVSTYLDAVQGRDDDLESARQNAKNLEETFRFIEQSIPRLQANHQIHVVTISKCVQSCRIQLTSLQDLLHKLGASPNLSGSFRDDVRDRKKKLAYPFHRSNLDRLESQLGKVYGTLQTALQVLEIREQQVANKILAGIENVTRDTPVELRRMNAEISAACSTLRGVDNALSPMRDAVAALGPLLTNKADETSTQLSRIESSIVSSMLVHQAMVANAVSIADQRNAAYERNFDSLQEMVLRRLISVPSALRSLSDELVPSQSATPERNTSITRKVKLHDPAWSLIMSQNGCLCRVRKQYQRNQSQWGPLRFYNQSFVENRHLPGCPRRKFNKDRSKQTYGVTYIGLVSIINTAVDLSYSMCFGAGGWSISREFRCISTVDYRTAPVFRLMKILDVAMHDPGMKISEWKSLFDSVLGKIRWLFDNRLGCPDDVDEDNQTVMFLVLDMVFGSSLVSGCSDEKRNLVSNIMRLLEVVRYYNVPVLSYDSNGRYDRTAFVGELGAFGLQPSWTAPIIDAIISPVSEILPFASFKPRYSGGSMHEMVPGFEVSQTYAECWGCGPLSLAIVAGDIEHVKHILQKQPTLLKETNLLKQTPFHLASGNPACLSLLLEALQPADYDLLDHGDGLGDNALVYAIAFSLKQCRSHSPLQKCRRCTCASSLVMLLKTNACSLPCKTRLRDIFDKDASLRCKIKFINLLKDQGETLRKTALDSPFWTSANTEACSLHSPDVLDAYANSVINILKTHGVRIPISIKSTYHDGYSVYHFIRNTADAQEFYRRGFRDAAVPDKWGFVPLDMGRLRPSYLSWLVEHGASLTPSSPRSARPISNCPCGRIYGKGSAVSLNRTHAHDVAFRAGEFVTHDLAELRGGDFRREEYSIKLLNTAVVPAEVVDDCNCPCSDTGCTPWTDLMKGLCDETHNHERVAFSVAVLAARLLAFLRISHELLGPSQLRAAIRFLTFSGLGMTHVCCWPCTYALELRPELHRWYTREEAREIRELESKELHVLECLVTEFSAWLNLQSSSFSTDLTALEAFWQQAWVSRMEEALKDLTDVADDEAKIKSTEEIGVVWEISDDEEEDELIGYTYWTNEIDEIMEDAKGLLKTKNS